MKHLTDEVLAVMSINGSPQAEAELIARYWERARIISRTFTIPGMLIEDKESEAVEALIKAARMFLPDKGMAFRTFAKRAVEKRMIELYRGANTAGRIPENKKLCLDQPFGDDDSDLHETVADNGRDPERCAIDIEDLEASLEALTDRDREEMAMLLGGRRDLAVRLSTALLGVAEVAMSKADVFDLRKRLITGVQPSMFDLEEDLIVRAYAEMATARRTVAESLLDGYTIADIACQQRLGKSVILAMFAAEEPEESVERQAA